MTKAVPVGFGVLVRVLREESKTDSGLYIHSEETQSARDYEVCEGIVVGIGQIAFKDWDCDPWYEVGDHILFKKYSGINLPERIFDDGELYRVIREEDAFLKIIE